MKKIYLDYAATTPVNEAVLDAMLPFFKGTFGNPSSIHTFGQEAKKAIENAREKIAAFLNCSPEEIFFTSGGTESNNLAIQGVISANGKWRMANDEGTKAQRHKDTKEIMNYELRITNEKSNNHYQSTNSMGSRQLAVGSEQSPNYQITKLPNHHHPITPSLHHSITPLHIITSSIEHHSILETLKFIVAVSSQHSALHNSHSALHTPQSAISVTFLPVDKFGAVSPEDVKKAINKNTILISIMYANNEIGTIQPIEEIGKIAQEQGIYFHTDAVQAVGAVPIDLQKIEVDLLSLSAHKIYGPKGVGALYVRSGTKINPIFFGGKQERKRRVGTENVAGIVGFGKAVELLGSEEKILQKNARLVKLRNKLINGILSTIKNTFLNGHLENRLPNNANLCFQGVEGESILLALDIQGIAASSGSACTSGAINPSHVLEAIGVPPELARTAVRFSLGQHTTEEEINYVLEILPPIVEKFRKISPI